jgi:hypothetical protein
MLRLLLLLFLLLANAAGAETASCQGRDLLAKMTPAEKAALIGDAPYPAGNFWQAKKGATTITVAGTYHLNDPRFDAIMPRILPYLDAASTLLVEAGPSEEKALKADIAAHPETLVNRSGPTLPEVLSAPEWSRLSAQLKAHGIPPFLAAKFQPWYVAMLIDLPVCKLTRDSLMGLDRRLMARAETRHIPIEALEPWDTTLKVFRDLGRKDQLAMLRMGLATDASPADLATTLAGAYFRGERQLIWAWSQQQALHAHAGTPAERKADFARMQRLLLTGRTRAWMKPLLAAARGRTVLVAVGAAHLGGRGGLLELLHQKGFTLTRLPF